MKDILEKLEKLRRDEFSSYLKNVLLNHEPFDELIEIKKIYPIEFIMTFL
jgi:predicted nucleotidyltransferase